MEKKNLEKLYENFIEDIEPTEEMKMLYDKLSKKILKLKVHTEIEQEIDELEDLFSRINDLEMKEAFYKGYSVANNIMLESKE